MANTCNTEVAALLTHKASLKQKIFKLSTDHFQTLKLVVGETAECMNEVMQSVDENVKTEFRDNGVFECELKFGGDLLLFNMHTNVFCFEKSNAIWKTGYVKENEDRGYFCMINIYNFLADSLRYNRKDDAGVLLGRIFMNAEGHFFVEGRKQLGILFNSLSQQKLSKDFLQNIVDTAVICSMEYDLTVPDYNDVMMVSVRQVQAMSDELELRTSKKVEMGYYSRMQKD
jgi:hypothetical protein